MQQNLGACDILVAYGVIISLARRSHWGLTGQTIHRQPSKNVIFNRQPSKLQVKIKRQVSKCFKSQYFS